MAENIPSSSQLIKYWDASATSKEFRHPIPEPLIKKYFPTGGKVLDIGCGQGRLAKYLADMGFSVAGTDTSTAMLEQAKKNVPGCEFRECRSSELTWRTILLMLRSQSPSSPLSPLTWSKGKSWANSSEF